MIEFYATVARKSMKGFSAEGWHSEQAVSREQALKMFTLWPRLRRFRRKRQRLNRTRQTRRFHRPLERHHENSRG
jgi:hypothetical protein